MSYFDIGCAPEELIARQGYSGVGGVGDVLSKIGGVIKDGAAGALDFYGKQQQAAGQLSVYQQQAAAQAAAGGGGLPSWVLPVAAVGGVGLIAVMMMGRRKNPARRHRRSRR